MTNQLLVSTSYTAKRHWHRVISTEPIGGGRYTRYTLACALLPHSEPGSGRAYLASNTRVVTASEPLDVLGVPMAKSTIGQAPGAPPEMTTLCSECFPDGWQG
jgi:hypothetical protein